MTLESTTSKAVYTGNGATTEFPFSFKVWEEAQILVSVTDAQGYVQETGEYSVTLSAGGGTVFYLHDGAPLPSGWKLAITRDMPFTQEDDYITGTRFDPEVIETALDKATAERQQLREQLQRAVILPPTSDETPEDMAQELLRARDDVQDMRDDVQDMLAEVGTEIGNHSIVTAEGGTAGRTLASRFADVVNVKNFGAKGDGVTDDTKAIQAAAKKADTNNACLFFPYGTYRITSSSTFFWAHIAVGEGVVVRDDERFIIGCPTGASCNLYASPTGGGDGLSAVSPATFDECMQAAISMSPFGGNLVINLLAGEYVINRQYAGIRGIGSNVSFVIRGTSVRKGTTTIGSIQGSSNTLTVQDSSNYIVGDRIGIAGAGASGKALFATITQISGNIFTISESSITAVDSATVWHDVHYPVKIMTANTDDYSDVLAFYSSDNVNIENVEIVQEDTTQNSKCIAGGYGVNYLRINNCRLHNNGWTAVLLQRGIRLVVSDSLIEGSGAGVGITAYGTMLSTNATGTRNVLYNLSSGIIVQGPAYAHNDYNDFVDCAYGTNVEYGAFSGNISCRYWNVPVRARTRGMSSFSITAGSSSWPAHSVQLFSNPLTDFEGRFPTAASGVMLPFAGTLGRGSEFYTSGNVSLFSRKEINLGNAELPVEARSKVGGDNTILITSDTDNCGISFLTQPGRNTRITHNSYTDADISDGAAVVLNEYGVQLCHRTGLSNETIIHARKADVVPGKDNNKSFGTGSYRWAQIYAATDAINTSDANEKQDIYAFSDDVLAAWGEVELRQFLFKEAVKKKGDAARIHAGVIAQQVVEAFTKYNLDATRYGLLCFDRWQDEYEDVEVIDAPAELDADGNEVTPAKTHTEKRLVTEAGERYGIRYSEALCMEAAYQRRRADRLEARIAALEAKLK